MMKAIIIIISSILVSGCFSYCPPLEAPTTTYLKCEEPLQKQRLDCSSSWLPKGSAAYFKCFSFSGKIVKGRILCFEDGMHRVIPSWKVGIDNNIVHLPCGITKNLGKPEIYIYGYEEPLHYKLDTLRENETDFHELAEILQNEFRKKHGSPPLMLHKQLSHLAQSWADKLVATGKLDMVPEQHYGQNIFRAQTQNLGIAVNDAIHNWYHSGLSQYSWKDVTANWYNSEALEFSQLIWKNSKFFGIGAASGRNLTVVIAFYDPPGNIIVDKDDNDDEHSKNLFVSNVPPLIS